MCSLDGSCKEYELVHSLGPSRRSAANVLWCQQVAWTRGFGKNCLRKRIYNFWQSWIGKLYVLCNGRTTTKCQRSSMSHDKLRAKVVQFSKTVILFPQSLHFSILKFFYQQSHLSTVPNKTAWDTSFHNNVTNIIHWDYYEIDNKYVDDLVKWEMEGTKINRFICFSVKWLPGLPRQHWPTTKQNGHMGCALRALRHLSQLTFAFEKPMG